MRLRILKFLTMFAVGGTERQFTYITKSLDRGRFDVRVGCLSREGEFFKEIEALNIPVSEYRIRSLYDTSTLKRQWRFARDVRRDGVQLVHAYGFYPNVFSIPAARLAGCVTIASVRDTGAFTSSIKMKTFVQKTACRLADRVVANSTAVRDWLLHLGLNERQVVIIPNGIAVPAEWRPSTDFPIRRELGISLNAPVVAVVCRLNKNKGLEYFLQAAALVSRRLPETRFLIVGGSHFDPQYGPSLERLARELNLSRQVIFTGERNDIPRLLEEINLSVLPSLSEGLSNSLLEAMAAGIPVVATSVGGNTEIVQDGHTGLLVPAREAEALGDAMIRLLESPELSGRFGMAGHERVKHHYSLAATVRQTEDLYTSLLQERK